MCFSHAQISLDSHQNLLVKQHIGLHPTGLHSAKAHTNRADTATKSSPGKRGCVMSEAGTLESPIFDPFAAFLLQFLARFGSDGKLSCDEGLGGVIAIGERI